MFLLEQEAALPAPQQAQQNTLNYTKKKKKLLGLSVLSACSSPWKLNYLPVLILLFLTLANTSVPNISS